MQPEDLDFGGETPTVNDEFEFPCQWCSATRTHRVVAVHETTADPDDTFDKRPVLREGVAFALSECCACEGPLLLGWRPLVDDLGDLEPDLMQWKQLYPTPPFAARRPSACPKLATELLDEAAACQAVSPTAAVVLARKAVEVVCVSLGFSGNLNSSLRRMRERHVIDERLWTWSDLLRQVGNQGAHDSETAIVLDDARDAVWFAFELIHQVFVVQPLFESFASRRPYSVPAAQLRLVEGASPASESHDALPRI